MIYDDRRYQTRGKFSEPKFNKSCLEEYAQTYQTVCVDAGYYAFPTASYLAGLCDQVPDGFQFGFKLTDEITVRRFANIPRNGKRAGLLNPDFLNAEMFRRLILAPCEPFRSKIGPLIFEFSQFHKTGVRARSGFHPGPGRLPRRAAERLDYR
jgi:uncharacterized protein YecE (DUF72 family)